MQARQPESGRDAFAYRGSEIFRREVQPRLGADDTGKVIAIDVETGEFALGADAVAASEQLRARRPHAQIWLERAGHSALHRIGGFGGP